MEKEGGRTTRRQGPGHQKQQHKGPRGGCRRGNTTRKKKQGGGERSKNKERQGPGHLGPGSTKRQRQRGRQGGGGRKRKQNGKKATKKKHPKHGQPQLSEGRTKKKDRTATGKGEAHQNAPGRPARTTRPGGARTHTRAGPERGVLRPERGGVGVHTKKPRCTGRVPRRTTDGTGNRTCQ